MAGTAYYNEHDPFAAAWLRELIADGLIAPGEVDERSIEDVLPTDLSGFRQCHFFAGIGIWSLALREAGWPDDTPIWTGSCPCQPFSAAGKGGWFADERHLWPAFHWLIEQCGPELVLGEQVASKDGLAWLDLVSADVEASGYAFGAADTCAASFGSPHIRQRLYWMADAANHHRGRGERGSETGVGPNQERRRRYSGGCPDRGLADADDARLEGRLAEPECASERALGPGSVVRGVGDALRDGDGSGSADGDRPQGAVVDIDWNPSWASTSPRHPSSHGRPGPLNGLWRDADWLCCTDGKWRPVESGTFPLAPAGTVRNRVGLLRGAGNALTLAQAQAFVEAVIETRTIAVRKAA